MDYLGDDIVTMENAQTGFISRHNDRYLCPLSKKHTHLLRDWRNSQMAILRQWRPLTDYDQEEWLKKVSSDHTQAIFSLMVRDRKKDTMVLIGYCGITNIDFRNGKGEISFLVNPLRAENEKLYREDFLSALHMLCEYGFEKINLNKLYTETFEFRKNHIKILEEFGLHLDGNLRKHVFVNGQYQDSLIHSMIASEWTNVRNR